jgi:sec-independent protein translocase protein TatA
MPGIPELLVILLIVMLIFGAGKLPAIGDAMGKTIRNFKKAAANPDKAESKAKAELAEKKRAEIEAHSDEEIEDAEVVVSERDEAVKDA